MEPIKRATADQVTLHLREDRRHIQDQDVRDIVSLSTLPVNVESSMNDEIIDTILAARPFKITLVPEHRKEITTESGLDLQKNKSKLKSTIQMIKSYDVEVALFLDPIIANVDLAKDLNADIIEFHSGEFSNIFAALFYGKFRGSYSIDDIVLNRNELKIAMDHELEKLQTCIDLANQANFKVALGHGLNYQNIKLLSSIKGIKEFNIGQSIIARSVFSGLFEAVFEMRQLIDKYFE